MNAELAEVTALPAHGDKNAVAVRWAQEHPDATDAEIGAQFGFGERWARNIRKEAGLTRGRGKTKRRTTRRPKTAPVVERKAARRKLSRLDRSTVAATAVALAVVVAAPVVLSFQSLAGWAHDGLGLEGWLTWVVPVTLDAAALTCVGLTFHAMLRADSAGAARLLVWVFAGASAVANWRHGTAISTDAAVYYPAMPLITALLLDITLRRVRRGALNGLGALEKPLPRYRAARWLVAPRETWGAWRAAVCEGITDPAAAITYYRNKRSQP